nr:addiction module antidote protein [Acaryochloris sp. IP29b_bin.137]
MVSGYQIWDVANHLETKEDIAAYLEAVLEDGDPTLITAALGDIAHSRGMTRISREIGLGRESLYQALLLRATQILLLSSKFFGAQVCDYR